MFSVTELPTSSPPPREQSPAAAQSLLRKRKHASATPNRTNFSSPAPDVPSNTLPPLNNLATRPRLTISRGPTFTPIHEGSTYFTTEQLPFNRLGFRYTPAGVAPPGSALPCTTIESAPTTFRVSWEDRSPLIAVTADGLGLVGNKGFRSARCNVPVREGKWYMEVKIERGGGDTPPDDSRTSAREGSHVRLGWGRRESPLNGPVGLDGYSYAFRDKTGEKVTLSRPRLYGRPFTTGDVIGMYISLPPRRCLKSPSDLHDPAHIKRERIAIELKGQEYFESAEYPQSKEMAALMDLSSKGPDAITSIPSSSTNKKSATVKNLPERGGPASRRTNSVPAPAPLRPLPTLEDSRIAFFVNGESQGIAFEDIYSYLQLRTTPASRKSGGRRNNRGSQSEFSTKHKENSFDDGTLGYYPFISLFNDARVRLNPGPYFEYPPPPDIDALLLSSEPRLERTWRPIFERYPEFMAEQWALDVKEEADAKTAAAAKAAADEMQALKQAQLEKRRAQASARRKAKKAALLASEASEPVGTPFSTQAPSPAVTTMESIRQGSATPAVDSPSPFPVFHDDAAASSLRHSPSPAAASSVDLQGTGPTSGYNSEHGNFDIDVEGDTYMDGVADADAEDAREGSAAISVGYPEYSLPLSNGESPDNQAEGQDVPSPRLTQSWRGTDNME